MTGRSVTYPSPARVTVLPETSNDLILLTCLMEHDVFAKPQDAENTQICFSLADGIPCGLPLFKKKENPYEN
jgi:hypothetical protein